MNKIKAFFTDSKFRFSILVSRGFFNWMSDEQFLKIIYKLALGKKLDLDNPITFNEKLNWLKLNDRNPQYSLLADKYEVKKIVAEKIGQEYVVPCYGAWDKFEDIDFDSLPEAFVLKANHDSSGATICKEKSKIDKQLLSQHFQRLLSRNYFYVGAREWPYKNIKPQILAEKLLEDSSGGRLRDYKFWCFNGEPLYMYCTVKGGDVYENFFDMNFNPVDISHGFRRLAPEPAKPHNFELMKQLAAQLSSGIPFVRIDFFEVNDKVYFGEYTFYDWGGLKPFVDYQQDMHLGSLINLDY